MTNLFAGNDAFLIRLRRATKRRRRQDLLRLAVVEVGHKIKMCQRELVLLRELRRTLLHEEDLLR